MKRVLPPSGKAIFALLAVAVITYCCFRLRADATIAAIGFMLTVLLTGAFGTLAEAILVACAATLSLDYFFIPPIGSITIADPQGWIVLAVFLVVSLIATNLSGRFRRQRDDLRAQQSESEKLHALSRAMLMSDGADELGRLIVNKTVELFALEEMVLFEPSNGSFYRSGATPSISDEVLRTVARCRAVHQDAARWTVAPIALGNKVFGSVALRGSGWRDQTLQALGSVMAMGIAQEQARDAASRTEAVRRSEELKSLMIDALAHDLKTPLTAIEAAGDMLSAPAANVSSEQRQDLLEVIRHEAAAVRRIVDEAIHLARIDAERLKLSCEPIAVNELIRAAITQVEDRYGAGERGIDIEAIGSSLVCADRELIVQAIKQLLDNALKYSPARTSITVRAEETEGVVTIFVRDHGAGLTELEQSRVFEKFYRGQQSRAAVPGTGMGLAITKEIAEAHGGAAGVRSEFGQGSEFFITLPAGQADHAALSRERA